MKSTDALTREYEEWLHASWDAAANEQQPAPAAPSTTLWFFDYVNNGLGVWARAWHGTRAEAEADQAQMFAQGFRIPEGGGSGEEWDMTSIYSEEMSLTPEGALYFIRQFGDANEF
jgi:hypothetical protein